MLLRLRMLRDKLTWTNEQQPSKLKNKAVDEISKATYYTYALRYGLFSSSQAVHIMPRPYGGR